ncbi:MAG: protoporphyrinogen oxidase [Prevotellaceae bacterium]|jgi:oxygen-dependent protoporphyrinogen oxidase|nr:protoporphyrinogen oxidase [Prevotellaceae bacterium]
MNNKTSKKGIIVGAGLTGLTIAFYLKKAGWNILVLEKDGKIGGAMKTFYENGFVFESGANTGTLGTPETAELFDELAPHVKLEIANSKAKKRLILKNGKFHALPAGLFSAITTPLFTLYDKFRILGEPFRKKGTDPYETVAQITRRRMGRSFLDYAMDPFVSGIYAGDPEKLVFRFALPKMWAFEDRFGSFVKGGIIRNREMKNDERLKRATREVMSSYGGFGNLIDCLAKRIGCENILCNASNIQIHPINNKWEVSFNQTDKFIYQANYVITTIGSHALPQLLPFIPREQMQNLNNARYAKMVQLSLGFKEWKGPPILAFGGLIPSKENRKILGVLFSSSFFKDRAPKNGALLIVYTGGIRHPEVMSLSDDEVKQTVLHELRQILQFPELEPDIIKIFRHPYAIPQYERSTEERLKAVDDVQKQYPNLIIGGNLRDGIGMADRIKQARAIADKLIAENL